MIVLSRSQWRERRRDHETRVRPWIEPRLARRSAGQKHPVDDFLFEYYRHRPKALLRWHPGPDTGLIDAPSELRDHRDYETAATVTTVSSAAFQRRRPAVERALAILGAQQRRPATFGCFGLHEWAMVYGLTQAQVRHEQLPLRLSPAQVKDVVDSHGPTCSHFDAYRFFTPQAQQLQRQLHRANQARDEQPGCLHAGMDLYRYAYEAGPLVPSELVADCFDHAKRARAVDMRASPYDVTSLGRCR